MYIYTVSTEYFLLSHDLLVEDPDTAVAHVGVGGADAGAAQVEQVPGVGVLVPPPSVLAHQERGDTCSQGLLAFKCIFGDIDVSTSQTRTSPEADMCAPYQV